VTLGDADPVAPASAPGADPRGGAWGARGAPWGAGGGTPATPDAAPASLTDAGEDGAGPFGAVVESGRAEDLVAWGPVSATVENA